MRALVYTVMSRVASGLQECTQIDDEGHSTPVRGRLCTLLRPRRRAAGSHLGVTAKKHHGPPREDSLASDAEVATTKLIRMRALPYALPYVR